ncbi:MAG: two-component regulator propeller domain-containing protein [Candidatus Hodarchaeota archaeon]
MNKTIIFAVLSMLTVIFNTCDKNFNPLNSSQNSQKFSPLIEHAECYYSLNTFLYTGNITIDKLGQAWFSTVFCDTSVEIPPWSSIACKGLWKICKFDGIKYCTIFDSLDIEINEIQLDSNDDIWILNSKQILKIDTNNRLSIIYDNTNNEGFFNSIAIDNQNNIWVGGLNTGLLKIKNSSIIKYTSQNSKLPTNSITKILIDENNTKWIALWDLQGLIKIENDSWTHYNSNNSNITQQNIWDLAKDSNGNLWLGTGWTDINVTLMKFDGIKFSIENPKDKNGSTISGTVRHIATNNADLVYVVSEETKKLSSYSSTLSVYDGSVWADKFIKYGDDIITDIECFNNQLWVSTFKEIYIIE